MNPKTYLILARIEADGRVIDPAAPDAPPVTAQLSDEAAASLLPLGYIAEAPAPVAANKPKLAAVADPKPAATSAKDAAKDVQ